MKKILILIISIILISSTIFFTTFPKEKSEFKFTENRPIKIFIINSYHPDTYEWTKGLNDGFTNYLKEEEILFETQIHNMNTKYNFTEEWKINTSTEAIKKINEWNPDVLYLTDDNAQEYIGKKFINTSTLIIFSGVNAQLEQYGYENSNNVAGILERENIEGSLKLFKKIFPDAKRIGIIGDESETARYATQNIARVISKSELNFNEYSTTRLDKYKEKILEYNENVDAILVLTTQSITNPRGPQTTPDEILEWTVQNSKIPEITFWEHDLKLGLLLGSVIVPEKQGRYAAEVLKKIIIHGKSPRSIKGIEKNDNIDSINIERSSYFKINQKEIEKLKQY